jgi:hypothetical protein
MRDVPDLIETRLPLEADEVSSPLVNHLAVTASEAASPVTVKNIGTGRKDRNIFSFASQIQDLAFRHGCNRRYSALQSMIHQKELKSRALEAWR